MTYRYPDALDLVTSTVIAEHGDHDWWSRQEDEDLAAVVSVVPPGGRVLDVGAGRGRLAVRLAEHSDEVVAIEPDPERAAHCVKAVAGRGNVAVVAADLLSARLEESSFDAVVCHHVLQHVPVGAVPPMVERIRRLLVPGGTMVIVTALAPAGDEFLALDGEDGGVAIRTISSEEFATFAAGGPGPLPVHLFADETLRKLLSPFSAVDLRPLGGAGVLRSVLVVAGRRWDTPHTA